MQPKFGHQCLFFLYLIRSPGSSNQLLDTIKHNSHYTCDSSYEAERQQTEHDMLEIEFVQVSWGMIEATVIHPIGNVWTLWNTAMLLH